MKSRVTILAAVFLLAALAMPQLAEAQGFTAAKDRGIAKVIASGNNQLLPNVTLTYDNPSDSAPIQRNEDKDLTITVEFGDLPIVNASAGYATDGKPDTVAADINKGDLTGTKQNWKWSSGDTTIQIFIPKEETVGNGAVITIADLRVDVSSLDAGNPVPIMVSASEDSGAINLGTGGPGTVSSTIVMAADGLTVEGTKAEGLSCGVVDGATVTITEGFAGAWTNMNASSKDDPLKNDIVRIRIEVSDFPDVEGAKITWPETVKHNANVAASGAVEKQEDIATLTLDDEDSFGNGRVVIYEYSQLDNDAGKAAKDQKDGLQPYLDDIARTFDVTIEEVKNFGSAEVNVSAQLWPAAKRNSDGKKNTAHLQGTLSFEHPLEEPTFADDARDGAWMVVSDCITYLLYPFVTCQATQTPEWTTGISVSNTSRDAGVFGTFDETEEQSGSVTFYGFPKSVATVNGSGVVPGSVVSMLTSNLAAGDTYTFSCQNSVMAGMEGYAIIKANFQHARGMGFVIGSDVAHGYMAEVIDNPADRSDTLSETLKE